MYMLSAKINNMAGGRCMYDKAHCLVKFGMMDSKDTAILDDQRVPSQSLTWKLKIMVSKFGISGISRVPFSGEQCLTLGSECPDKLTN